MSSSPQRTPRTTPRSSPRTTPKSRRTPLQERTRSEANQIFPRTRSDLKSSGEARNVYATSPFPTKPQQILLPSTLRKQKSSQNLVADVFATKDGPATRGESQLVPGSGKRPVVRLKRSVKTLRDQYEAQAELSRPSSALSAGRSRPSTSSSKMRSYSSSEGLSGRYAWEQLRALSSDDLALLPSLPEGNASLKRLESQSSFAYRAAKQAPTSSPNFRVLGATSSPKLPVFRDLSEVSSDPSEQATTDATSSDEAISSPNIIKLGRTSSFEDTPGLEPPSPTGRNVESSPARTIVPVQPSSMIRRTSSASSNASRKRKRSEVDEGRSFAARAGATNPFPSSPPLSASDPSPTGPSSALSDSLPSGSIDESSPVIRVLQNDSSSIEQSSVTDTHASLQDAISSSPVPPIQYPVVRAPVDVHSVGIIVPKRKYRASHTTDSSGPKWPSRLSAPSQDSFSRSRGQSARNSWADSVEDLDMDAFAPEQAYMMDNSANNSQIRMVLDSDRHEGEDEVSALPGDEYAYRSPPLLNRSTSYLGSASSSQSRLGSLDLQLARIRSYSHSRANSLRSLRPDSSNSAMSSVVVPTWARRYYSGFYPDSFRYLATSASNMNLNHVYSPPQTQPKYRAESLATATTSRSSRQSLQSLRESITSIFRPKNRPRLEARKSHTMPGVGPLVSNPICGPATAAISGARQARYEENRLTIRPVSFPLSLQDPRAHWNGIAEGLEHIPEDQAAQPSPTFARPISADPSSEQSSVIYYPRRQRWGRRPSESPHLHHDHRLNTGSTASRGFGAPFNRKSYLSHAPSVYEERAGSLVRKSRNAQIGCFLSGFVLPFTWFIGALIPLPQRPEAYHDIEKNHWEQVQSEGPGGHGHNGEMDVLARLRLEKQIMGSEEVIWQNVKWWRTLNRWMSIVGALVLVLVIVLAVVGTLAWGQ